MCYAPQKDVIGSATFVSSHTSEVTIHGLSSHSALLLKSELPRIPPKIILDAVLFDHQIDPRAFHPALLQLPIPESGISRQVFRSELIEEDRRSAGGLHVVLFTIQI